ncbi:Protein CBG10359 [Caenorhabditis briggsae]|uniref:Protein CBG10359 n=1 Tax=Caenorhabditis briggsae TaxID=6238 RepID=A8XB13_CAEBR|nr:Protein CBG10359 [Caenorhabditis briggsae]CAP29793.2 Protein CBG10359 [Caenorhabditis briggsae]
MQKQFNWTLIAVSCPEFKINQWDLVFYFIAFVGLILTSIQMWKFRKKRKEGSSFLGMLTDCDFVICLFFLVIHLGRSIAFQYQNDILAALRIEYQIQIKACKTLFDTVQSTIPFCDVEPYPIVFAEPAIQIIQLYIVPGISAIASVATLAFAILTIPRLSKIGEEEDPVVQEETKLMSLQGKHSNILNTVPIRRSIICMLVVYATFFIRTVCYHIFIDPFNSDLFQKTSSARNLTVWWYDAMSVVFSGSRLIVYYVFCRDQIVTEFPPTAIGQ